MDPFTGEPMQQHYPLELGLAHVDGGVWFSRPGGLVFGGGVWCMVLWW